MARKELLAILKDRRSRASLFVPPILQCLIYGYAATYDLNTVQYAVLDQDRSPASHNLLAHLDGSGVFVRVADLQRQSDIGRIIDRQRALLVIQIPQDFERSIDTGEPANVQVIADARNSNTAGTATAYVGVIVDSFNAQWRAAHGMASPPVQVRTRAWFNPNLETRWQMIPALIGTLTLLQRSALIKR